jgi:hypothetical protein
MLKILGKVFVAIGKALVRVFKVAEERGLAGDIVTQAKALSVKRSVSSPSESSETVRCCRIARRL